MFLTERMCIFSNFVFLTASRLYRQGTVRIHSFGHFIFSDLSRSLSQTLFTKLCSEIMNNVNLLQQKNKCFFFIVGFTRKHIYIPHNKMRRSDIYETNGSTLGDPRWTRTGRRTTNSDAGQQSFMANESDRPWDDLGQEDYSSNGSFFASVTSWLPFLKSKWSDDHDSDDDVEFEYRERFGRGKWDKYKLPLAAVAIAAVAGTTFGLTSTKVKTDEEVEIVRPGFVFEHPYISSSYYTSTKSLKTLESVDKFQVQPKKEQLAGKKMDGQKDFTRDTQTRLAILRPFCAFDAGPLPTTFDCKCEE